MSGKTVTCAGVSKTFAAGDGSVEALGRIDLVLDPGTTTAIVGPSGCGKSSLLRIIAGLEAPSNGEIRIGGERPEALAARGGLAMAFQDPALLPWRTVRANIALALKLARKPVAPAKVDTLIELVGLGGFGDHRPATLSGGMRQRAAIARCLITEPELLLLDEPFAAVDMLTRKRLNTDLPPLWRAKGSTAILVTHSVTEASALADRILIMSDRPGRIIADISSIDRAKDGLIREIEGELSGAVA